MIIIVLIVIIMIIIMRIIEAYFMETRHSSSVSDKVAALFLVA